ncbi:DUF808 domain-containing protein [Nigerium massiliense]|uniref:DUF808 domain-containing protein n=1 Tax=Nigerium massiliense TaxID=1522317 RepID=UPI000907BD8E|nr:DUF808 domain-containing protein [Nigerium massiliense]
MAGGLAALLDDVAMIAKMASAASTKAVGVVVDDTAVTPRYVQGFSPARELPIIWKIAKGSLRNKIVFILPAALLLSQFVPWLLTPILMLGGTYLCFEGAEKVWEAVTGHGQEAAEAPAAERGPDYEDTMVSGAIRTDFILSAEIMVISLGSVANEPLIPRAVTLIIVALVITALVYGVVALLVKLDDIGLAMTETDSTFRQRAGRVLVSAMPKIMNVLSGVGIVAMLWVGGHILLVGADTLGWHAPYQLVHHLAEPAAHVAGVGGFLGWLVETLCSAVGGLIVGAVVVAIMHVLPFRKGAGHASGDHDAVRDEVGAEPSERSGGDASPGGSTRA